MIQFNLLPDVKLEYVRAQRVKHTVISAALIAAGSTFLIFLLLFLAVNVLQKKNISDLTGDIKSYNNQLKSTRDLDKILTIQSQLKKMPELHAEKVAASRTFKYIQQITPAGVTLTEFTDDYVANTVTITGQTASLDKVNTFVDTVKFTKYSDKDVVGQKAFSGVVLSQFTRSTDATTFTISASYEPTIFDNANSGVSLAVPSGITTTSITGQPANIFSKTDTNSSGNN